MCHSFSLASGVCSAEAIGTTEYEFAPTHSTARCIKPTPLIAVGIEKFSQNDFRMRFELEYRFGVGKKHTYFGITETAGNSYRSTIKASSKGVITLRAVFVRGLKNLFN